MGGCAGPAEAVGVAEHPLVGDERVEAAAGDEPPQVATAVTPEHDRRQRQRLGHRLGVRAQFPSGAELRVLLSRQGDPAGPQRGAPDTPLGERDDLDEGEARVLALGQLDGGTENPFAAIGCAAEYAEHVTHAHGRSTPASRWWTSLSMISTARASVCTSSSAREAISS